MKGPGYITEEEILPDHWFPRPLDLQELGRFLSYSQSVAASNWSRFRVLVCGPLKGTQFLDPTCDKNLRASSEIWNSLTWVVVVTPGEWRAP